MIIESVERGVYSIFACINGTREIVGESLSSKKVIDAIREF